MRVECPFCKEQYNVKKKLLGKKAVCKMCESSFILRGPNGEVYQPRPKRKLSDLFGKLGGKGKKGKGKKGKGNRQQMIMIAGIVVLVLALAGGGVYYFMNLRDSGSDGESKKSKKEERAEKAEENKKAKTAEKSEKSEKSADKEKKNESNLDEEQIKNDINNGFVFSADMLTLEKAPENVEKYAIPKGVVSIGKEAFKGCQQLTEVTFPHNTVTTIHMNAFADCKKLSKIVLPKSLSIIGAGAFENAGCEAQVKQDYPGLYK